MPRRLQALPLRRRLLPAAAPAPGLLAVPARRHGGYKTGSAALLYLQLLYAGGSSLHTAQLVGARTVLLQDVLRESLKVLHVS